MNALAVVVVYRGLLDKLVQNEAQLAAVLGREIGHVDTEHGVGFFKPVKASSQLLPSCPGAKRPGKCRGFCTASAAFSG